MNETFLMMLFVSAIRILTFPNDQPNENTKFERDIVLLVPV
jgi:hypothetical protein